jgi:hypothetical protein
MGLLVPLWVVLLLALLGFAFWRMRYAESVRTRRLLKKLGRSDIT